MADEAAVLDAPVLDVVDEVVEPVLEETAEVAEVPEPVEVKGDERVMPQWIKNLKATDPLGFKAAKADFFGKRALDEKLKDFDLDGTKNWLTEVGGREAIETQLTELQGKAAELDQINQAIAEGKTEILDSIPAESLSKLAPAVAQKWAEADPEGWGHAMTGILVATLTQENQNGDSVASVIKDISIALRYADTEGVKAAVEKLQGWTNGMIATARTPLQRATPQAAKGPDVNQERQQWETEKFTTQLTEAVESARTHEIEKSLESFFSRRPKDADAKELAISNVRQKVLERLNGDQEFKKSVNALIGRRDKDGAARLIKAREAKAIEDIAPKVGRTIFGNPAAAQVQKPAATAKPEAGFSLTDKPPRPDMIDRSKTSDAMIMRGKFILKDGSRLTLEA